MVLDKVTSTKRPYIIFAVTLLLSSILLVLLGWHVWDSYHDSKMIQSKDFQLIELSWTVFHRDEVLAISVRMAATTGSPEWEKRYQDFASQLNNSLIEAKVLYPEEHISQAISQVEAVNKRLTLLEERVFDLVRQGDKDSALQVLSSNEYEEEMLIFSQVASALVDTVRIHMESALRHQGRQAYSAVVWGAVMLPVLITSWFSALMMLKRYLDERNRAETALCKSEERYRMLVETMNEGLGIQDENCSITYANDKLCEMLGYAREELIGHSFTEFLAESSHSVFEEEMVKRIAGLRTTYEVEMVRKDGAKIAAIISAAPLLDEHSGFRGSTGTVTDITRRKRAEEALKIYAARLERSNEELREFTFVASHQLQEPLRKVRVFSSLLSTKYKELLDDRGRRYIERMNSAAGRAQHLIYALLDYSRIAVTQKPQVVIRLQDAIEGALAELKTSIEEAGAQVELEDETCGIEADRDQMRMLFRCLIENALKFSHNEGPVIKIHGSSLEGECRIFIEDNGIGFEEKYLDQIFRPFQRLHGHNEYEGMGIGLAIGRKIAENHGGNITARSKPGEGSTFIVALPVRQLSNEYGTQRS